MSDLATSALAGAQFNGDVLIEDAGPRAMLSLRADLADPILRKALRAVLSLDVPGMMEVVANDTYTIAWFSPDELLILGPYGGADDMVATLSARLSNMHHLVLNVSDARACLRLSGRALRDTLAKLTPADMSAPAFTPGTCRRTRLAQVPVAIWMLDAGKADLVCFRSVAGYVFDILCNAARPGSGVDFYRP